MQIVFEVADHLVTCSASTAVTIPALATMIISWYPSRPCLTYGQTTIYQQGKEEALAAATRALGISPMIVEPPAPRSSPPARHGKR